MLSCSFTGHRQIKIEHTNKLSDMLMRAIKYAYSKGCRRFICGGAIGFDTEAAKEIIKFRVTHSDVTFVLMLPCLNQSVKWSESQRSRYEYTLSVADEVVYVSQDYTSKCMKERNERLAKEGDIIIAYVCRNNSGAAQTVRMATNLGKEVYNLYPALERIGQGSI